MLLIVMVPPVKSVAESLEERARRWRRERAWAMERMERALTAFMLGTRRPWGVSMAMPMLWFERVISFGGGVGELALWVEDDGGGGTSTREFRRGKSVRARETALIMKGR